MSRGEHTTNVDVMAFGAHPDDIELGCGGTLIKLSEAGYKVVLVDLTLGELATRGDEKTRCAEAVEAARILGAVARENLLLEDGHITLSREAKRRVVGMIRQYRPRAVFLPYYEDRHPDHYRASELIYEAAFLAGLVRYETGQPPHRPHQLFYYMGWYTFEPTFVVDITAQFERKMAAIYAYASQFRADDPRYPPTRLTSSHYDWALRQRMGYYGSLVGVQYGEGFLIRGWMKVGNPLDVEFASF